MREELTLKKVESFLYAVDKDFPICLSEKVDLKKYAKKLCNKASIFYEEEGEKIIAMLAGYTEDLSDNIAYIALLATLTQYRGQGFAKKLMLDFFVLCRKKNIKAVHLYTTANNQSAQKLYKHVGFKNYILKNEPRPNDVHLIYYL